MNLRASSPFIEFRLPDRDRLVERRVKKAGRVCLDMTWNPGDTPVRRLLDELAPGERREHKRTIEPTGKEGRFWEVAMDGNILGSSLVWVNDDTRPSVMDGETQFVSMSELPVPLLQASDEECRSANLIGLVPIYIYSPTQLSSASAYSIHRR
jgi:hypothetical protein